MDYSYFIINTEALVYVLNKLGDGDGNIIRPDNGETTENVAMIVGKPALQFLIFVHKVCIILV